MNARGISQVGNASRQTAIRGIDLDPNTRCLHYGGPSDVIAIKMRCCDTYYACIECHTALAYHPTEVWPESDWGHYAVLCGVCRSELTIREYVESGNYCPRCTAAFNPGCRNHYHLYFEMPSR